MGIDLAWSTRARTGIAVVDVDGALIDSATVQTDDDILGWIEAVGTPLTVGIDAPLIVTNATGQRECERDIGRAYARYRSSCHTSNLGRPYFDPPRALTLAERAGWSTDPEHRGGLDRPGSIEVYPHAGMVGLFRLGSVIPYKAKKGRTVEFRKHAFADLIGRLEGITELRLADHPRWQYLTGAVRTATRPVDLKRAEDEIDGIFCAHLAHRWQHRDGLQIYGSRTDGHIIAPPPPDHPVVAWTP